MDTIRINALEIWTRIGVPEEERQATQRLLVSVTLHLPLQPTALSDDPVDGIDYAKVVQLIEHLAETERKTVERFAEDCASAIVASVSCKRVDVTVSKFPFAQAQSIEITISRP